ncbi:MAG TPA: response regulator transcription factor [Geodermatophilus sp.]|nr:response regulator transcription factor [Geodermatophilus sp.]
MDAGAIAVALVEDHPFFRSGLFQAVDAAPDMRLVAAAGSVEEFGSRDVPADTVILLDLHLPGLQGPAAVRHLRAQGRTVLVLSASESPADVVQAVRAGAAGYLSKHVDEEELWTAIRTVASGGTYVSPVLASYLLETPICLTQREREILELVAAGETDQDIADLLVISVHTVHSHLDRIRQKTGSHRRTELARLVTGDQDDPHRPKEG